MKNIFSKTNFTMTALLIASSAFTALAQGNGNNQPAGQAGPTGATNVVVTNTTAQPVPAKDMNNAAYQPFHFSGPITTNGAFGLVNVPVPAGKTLVIEQLSGEVSIWNTPGSIPSISVRSIANGVDGSAWVPMTYIGEGDNGLSYFAIQQVRLYASGGTNVSLNVYKSRDINHLYSGTVSGYISITGHFVNVP